MRHKAKQTIAYAGRVYVAGEEFTLEEFAAMVSAVRGFTEDSAEVARNILERLVEEGLIEPVEESHGEEEAGQGDGEGEEAKPRRGRRG